MPLNNFSHRNEVFPLTGTLNSDIHTVINPSSKPESGLGGACNLSIDHFSMIDDTWLFSVFRILNPVMLTPLYR